MRFPKNASIVSVCVVPSTYQLDGSAFQTWDPDDDAANRIPDGVHEICFYAVDVAGNAEVGGDPKSNAPDTNCRAAIKVDAQAPVATAPIDPATPDGAGGFYRSAPTIDPSASDAGGGPYPGGFRDAGDGSVSWNGRDDEGRRVLAGSYVYRVQAIDQAGNAVLSTESRPLLVRIL